LPKSLPHHEIRTMRSPASVFMIVLLAGCSAGSEGGGARARHADTLTIAQASSLARPMRALLDSFSRRTGTVILVEHGASLELARRITELHRVPDVIALADEEVMSELLLGPHVAWQARFARNRMVVAYTDRSRGAADVDSDSWFRVVARPGVLLGRTDPELAPAGYRTLITYRLAESHYRQPGLAARLTSLTPPARMRSNAAELAALLEAGELDYIVEYESVARAYGFRWVRLPPEIDLGDAGRASEYTQATVRVKRGRDSVTIAGAPIAYAVSVPRAAPHAATGNAFVAFLLGPEGRRLLRAGMVDALEAPVVRGDSVPAAVSASLAP
jgi:molybdate/tungstate transport system substrate-binding protein